MRCLFCKNSSDTSRSVEHIIPESLGNTRRVLPRGVVCDGCNNYFSRKVEGPLLNHALFRNLRAWHRVKTKQGKLPSLVGFVAGTDIDIAVTPLPDGALNIRPERGADIERWEERCRREAAGIEPNVMVFPLEAKPPQQLLSRFLAKMALEAVAERFLFSAADLERLVDEEHFDRIRDHARTANTFTTWPCHSRRIYPMNTLMRHPTTNEWVQAGFGYDLFVTKRAETFFAFCLYGLEFVINVGGPSIKGYDEWLADHNRVSPLVERVGARLTRRPDDDKYYLEGEFKLGTGGHFDRKLLDAGL